MDARAVMAWVEKLVDGPLSDPAQIQANLRYILEGLEGVHSRHRAPKVQPQDEELRQLFLQHLNGLYLGLEELGQGLLSQDRERLLPSLEQIRAAVSGLQSLEERLENETEVSHETL
ncbi:MAG: hypothetical protein KF760_23005 [Candidatus Eremiobacteraeota bacterium]|nr:hypothetical protein [Candidatus Eremiobacteraeota bacterium]MCW5868381.1 hypothetical protein [Candidatus Eremiobacteraeota bacterium]